MSYRLENRPIGFGIDPVTNEDNKGIEGNFFIPAYQRGYRWTQDEVHKLLKDLLESIREGKMRYSLQPIVVKGRADGGWELIDGQQRLTTLWLIFKYIQNAGYMPSDPAYSLEYETRPGSHAYLQTLDPAKAKQNIDYFHLYNAYQAIGDWIDSQCATPHAKQARVNQIYGYLSNSVRVIWYEVPEDEEPIPLFTRLNRGRIPLTDSELIKAVLLTHIEKTKPGRQTEVAAQWDSIERDLQRAEIWAFVAPQGSNNDQHGTRIDLLLDALAKKPTTGARRYHTFDALQDKAQNEGLAFWDEVVALHAQILGWLEEPIWYNKIGFLVACGTAISDIFRWAQGSDTAPAPTKSDFESILNKHIKSVLKTTFNEDLDALRYNDGNVQQVLLLFNVAICRGRFPFEKHTDQAWSLEHIHAQNAQDLNRAEQWETWLQEHRTALCALLTGSDTIAIERLLADIDAATPHLHTRQFGQEEFKTLAGKILQALNNGVVEEADHSIANLALLSHGANAALSNAVFEVKRHKVLEMDRRGDYIPAATRNVFLKYYTPADKLQPHFWSAADKDAYLKTIKSTLAAYLR